MTVPVQITGLLGLAESATVDDTVAAIKQLQENEQVALNRAQTPDLTKFVPVGNPQSGTEPCRNRRKTPSATGRAGSRSACGCGH
ncbi:hypothetical protein [Escherichia coli]|uniref:hypothetical protein n=1 Tax=Escherichia coli TaxID=562 RepID=UPI002FCD0E9D